MRPRPALLTVAICVLLPPVDLAAQTAPPVDDFRERLAALAPGAWIASNARWQEEDGGTERYGLDWELFPGGVAARGCLWGERGETQTVYWEFAQYWDPITGDAVVVQTGAGGAIALGRFDPSLPESEMMIQTMVQPDGSRFEIGHTAELEGADVRIDRSFQRPLGTTEWTEGRSYRWERTQGVTAPCWG